MVNMSLSHILLQLCCLKDRLTPPKIIHDIGYRPLTLHNTLG